MMRPLWKAIEFFAPWINFQPFMFMRRANSHLRFYIIRYNLFMASSLVVSDTFWYRHYYIKRIVFLKIFRIRYFCIFTSDIHVPVHCRILARITFCVLEENCERYISCLAQNMHLISTIYSLEKCACCIHIIFLFIAGIIRKLTRRIIFFNNFITHIANKPNFFK